VLKEPTIGCTYITALQLACSRPDDTFVVKLLGHGADPNIQGESVTLLGYPQSHMILQGGKYTTALNTVLSLGRVQNVDTERKALNTAGKTMKF
jgi:ankyrin repeat protein